MLGVADLLRALILPEQIELNGTAMPMQSGDTLVPSPFCCFKTTTRCQGLGGCTYLTELAELSKVSTRRPTKSPFDCIGVRPLP